MTRWSAITRTPPQLLRARLRLTLHSRGENHLNLLIHHERGRYSDAQIRSAEEPGGDQAVGYLTKR